MRQAVRVGLTKEEKSVLRSMLVYFMRSNPATNQVLYRHQNAPRFSLAQFVMRPASLVLGVFLTLGIGGSVAFAAGNAMPGNALYPLKVHVLEEARGTLALTAAQKATWASERMELRLQEAETLASRGALDEDAFGEIEDNFNAHADTFADQAQALEAEGKLHEAAKLHSDLEATLHGHASILKDFVDATDADHGETAENLLLNVEAQNANSVSVRQRLEDSVENGSEPQDVAQEAAQQRLIEAEQKIAKVRLRMKALGARMNADVQVQAEAKLKEADQNVADGKAKLEAKHYGEAFVLFQAAHRLAQEAQLLFETSKELHINIQLQDDTQDDNTIDTTDDKNHSSSVQQTTRDQVQVHSQGNEENEEDAGATIQLHHNKIDSELKAGIGL